MWHITLNKYGAMTYKALILLDPILRACVLQSKFLYYNENGYLLNKGYYYKNT